ncbi:hypothetical protein MNBD_ALPHA08-1229 [hydrothermal vent metagenome]|uniref:DUF2336 domain-containing protein n=1 Tax=hydrothermal vent metagenome TaxID=652676 RepID=A0A3B0SA49_9ZZZZ
MILKPNDPMFENLQVSKVTGKSLKSFNTSIFDRVLEQGSVEEKKNLTEQLGLLACDMSAPALEREAIAPTLLRLAADPVKDVRVLLARILVHCEQLHPDIVFSIIADDEDVSLPFLADSPALDRLRALAVLKVGDKARQLVLAGRPDLSDDAICFIADQCDSEICVVLLDNDKVGINVKNYRRMYVRFRDVPEVTEQLLRRDDLPLEVRILQAKKASSNVQRLMAERGWIPAKDAEEIIVDAEETTLLRILGKARDNEIDGLIPFLASKNLLTPSIILRAACAGDMRVIERALAYLSSTPLKKVERIISDRAAMALKGIYHKCGLPKNCFHIVRAAVDVSGELEHLASSARKLRFGSAVIECLMTRYNSISAQEKSELLEIVARLSDDNTRNLARRLAGQLQAA